jgi:hypothetical protein
MKEKPHKRILDRENPREFLDRSFGPQLALMEEIVNYGTNLIIRAMPSGRKELHDLILLSFWLRHFVAMLDSTHCLLAQGAVGGARVCLRAVFEASLALRWALKTDTELRCRYFYVWHLRRQGDHARKFIPHTAEHRRFAVGMGATLKPDDWKKGKEEAIERLTSIRRALRRKEFKMLNREFVAARGKRDFDKPWYYPTGPRSLAQLAKMLDAQGLYDILYSELSEIAHSQAIGDSVQIRRGSFVIEPIRDLAEFEETFSFSISMSFEVYRRILERYRPDELPNFRKKFIAEWRDRFRNIKKTEYNTVFEDLS